MANKMQLIDFEKARKSVMDILAGKVSTVTAVLVATAMQEATVDWIPSSEQKPTKEDGDRYGRVLVIEHGFISCAFWQAPINFPDDFPYWMPMPKPPKK